MSTVAEPDTNEHEIIAPEEAPVPVAAEPDSCPNCGAPAASGQLMCLECGSRLALDYQRAPSWRLPAAIVGVVVLLAATGVAIALAAVTNDADKTTAAATTQATPAPTAPADTPPTASQATPPAQEPSSTTTTPAAPSDDAAAGTDAGATPAPAPDAATGWPPGKSAFTVILASMPTEAAAEDKLEKAKAAGITTAAILHSDDFPTLRAGYWVVFDGQYDTTEQANSQAEADRGKGEFGDAYPRFVSKNQDAKP